MKEIERKIFGINVKEINAKLLEIGAEKTFEGVLKVRYLDSLEGIIREKGDLLRVREFEGRDVEIVYKTNKRIEDECKVFDEYTCEGKDFENILMFLSKLGFSSVCKYEKKRTIFKLSDAEIVIDEYPKMEPFIEIESHHHSIIARVVEDLGLTENESSCETINELIERKYPDLELNNLTFS